MDYEQLIYIIRALQLGAMATIAHPLDEKAINTDFECLIEEIKHRYERR